MGRFSSGAFCFISVVMLGEIRKGCELLAAGKRRKELEVLEVEVRE